MSKGADELELTNSIDRCVEALRGLGARRILLFGSALTHPETAHDIDLACEGLPPGRFYGAVGLLLEIAGRPVDLIDLSRSSAFTRHIEADAKVLYDAR